MNNRLRFVVSVLDNGHERNFVAHELRLKSDNLEFPIGKATHSFKMSNILDLAIVDLEADRALFPFGCERRPPRPYHCQPPSDL